MQMNLFFLLNDVFALSRKQPFADVEQTRCSESTNFECNNWSKSG